ncbi:MAG: PhoH family protein [Actinomycetota bacterium]
MTSLLGRQDELLRRIEAGFGGSDIHVRGNEITVRGADAELVGRLFRELVVLLEQGHQLDAEVVDRTIQMVKADESPTEILGGSVLKTTGGRSVRPKTANQKRYLEAMAENTVTFGLGPAGTGKTWLAVAMAVKALQSREVARIVLTRPAVEAGERLGFLPGDLSEKIDPYLRPLFDALYDMVDPEAIQRMLGRSTIEVAPLAFMRGRTLNQSFIILDEAQNTTPEQMKMFLTRIGFGSKAVITGDTTQVDIERGRSGLAGLEQVMRDVDNMGFVHLTGVDVVRHKIVQDIVDAYERASRGPG